MSDVSDFLTQSMVSIQLSKKSHKNSKSTSLDCSLPLVSTIDKTLTEAQQQERSVINELVKQLKVEHDKRRSGEKKLQQVHGKSRIIENYYKKNLKQAFEDKIKTFRLKSYMDRKDESIELNNMIRERELSLLQDKMQKVQEVRLCREIGKRLVISQISQRAERAKLQSRSTKQECQGIAKTRQFKASLERRKIHDEIRSQQLEQRQKRELLTKLDEMKKRQLHALSIKKELQEIIEKQDKLCTLKEELIELTKRSQLRQN